MSNHESGLEVVTGPRAGSDGPQVIPRELESIPTSLESWRAIHGPVEKEGQQPQAENQAEMKPSGSGRGVKSACKGWKWCIIICVIILVVVGIILGGVLGSRSKDQATNDSNSVSSPTGGNSSTQTLPIRNNSLLSVTGHKQENSGWTARLVFQGTDDKLRFIDRTGPDGAWSAVTTLGLVELAPNGSFGISTYLIGGIIAAQYQLYYTSASGQLYGLIFKNGSTPMTGDADSINTLSFIAPNGTSVATYFPYILMQDDEAGQMLWYGYKYDQVPGYFDLTENSSAVLGSLHTDMVVLPMNAWLYQNTNLTLTAGFFYRAPDSTLAFSLGEPTVPGTNDSSLLKWNTTDGGFPNVSLPDWSAIGGFAVARTIYAMEVDTHLLYQDGNGTIQVLSQQDAKPWKGPETFDAFNGADMGTSIACLTMGAYNPDDTMHTSLSTSPETNRCYFQSEGRLKEVWYDGSEWRDCGAVATGPAA